VLKSLLFIWVLSAHPEAASQAYVDAFDYRVGDTGTVSTTVAEALGHESLAGARYVTIYPPSGPQVGIRWIASDASEYQPMRRLGWSAIEVMVQDPDGLVPTLDPNHFSILAEPAYLTAKQNVRASQVLGPSDELLYLTHIKDTSTSFLNTPPSETAVGHPFIMVAGTRDLAATLDFFSDTFANPVTPAIPFKIEVLSEVYGLEAEHLHDLALVRFEDNFGLELDQYPTEASGIPTSLDKEGGTVLVTASLDPDRLKRPLNWIATHTDDAGNVIGGVIKLPSGTALEVIFD
jgi:catechol 2,3-dioxygenase-like lactoylglutathione lyase family enzyme